MILVDFLKSGPHVIATVQLELLMIHQGIWKKTNRILTGIPRILCSSNTRMTCTISLYLINWVASTRYLWFQCPYPMTYHKIVDFILYSGGCTFQLSQKFCSPQALPPHMPRFPKIEPQSPCCMLGCQGCALRPQNPKDHENGCRPKAYKSQGKWWWTVKS